jgi:hypothetical protein
MGLTVNLIEINRKSKFFADEYDIFINELRGQFSLTLSSNNPASPSSRSKFLNHAMRLQTEFLVSFKRNMKTATNSVIQMSIIAALDEKDADAFWIKHEKALVYYSEESTSLVAMSVEGLTGKDIKYGADQLKMIGFNTMTTLSNAGVKNAIKGAVVKNMIAGKNYTGSGGKDWRSIESSRLITRHHFINVFNEVSLFIGNELGDDSFVVKTFNNTNQFHDRVILSSEYDEIKSNAFHPNSNALIYRINKSKLTDFNQQ